MRSWLKAFRSFVIMCILISATSNFGQEVSPEISKFLQDAPLYDENGKKLLETLKLAGGQSPSDLAPYLAFPGSIRTKTLWAISLIGSVDTDIVDHIECIILKQQLEVNFGSNRNREYDGASEQFALAIILNNRLPKDAMSIMLSFSKNSTAKGIEYILAWIEQQKLQKANPALSAEKLDLLIEICCKRLEVLFKDKGDVYDAVALSVASSFDRPPLNDIKYLPYIISAYGEAIKHPEYFQSISIDASFGLIMKNADRVPELSYEVLSNVLSGSSLALSKIVLSQIFIQKFEKSDMGIRLIKKLLDRQPELTDYLDQLRAASSTTNGIDSKLKMEISDAMKTLKRK